MTPSNKTPIPMLTQSLAALLGWESSNGAMAVTILPMAVKALIGVHISLVTSSST